MTTIRSIADDFLHAQAQLFRIQNVERAMNTGKWSDTPIGRAGVAKAYAVQRTELGVFALRIRRIPAANDEFQEQPC